MQYQGGVCYQVYSPQGAKPLDFLTVQGSASKQYDKASKSQVVVVEPSSSGAASRVTVPRHVSSSASSRTATPFLLTHPCIGIQLNIASPSSAVTVEIVVVDSIAHRRLLFSTHTTTFQATPQHVKIPVPSLPRLMWLDWIINVRSIFSDVYEQRSVTGYRGIASISLSFLGKVRKIYTLAEEPVSERDIPSSVAFPDGIHKQTVLLHNGTELMNPADPSGEDSHWTTGDTPIMIHSSSAAKVSSNQKTNRPCSNGKRIMEQADKDKVRQQGATVSPASPPSTAPAGAQKINNTLVPGPNGPPKPFIPANPNTHCEQLNMRRRIPTATSSTDCHDVDFESWIATAATNILLPLPVIASNTHIVSPSAASERQVANHSIQTKLAATITNSSLRVQREFLDPTESAVEFCNRNVSTPPIILSSRLQHRSTIEHHVDQAANFSSKAQCRQQTTAMVLRDPQCIHTTHLDNIQDHLSVLCSPDDAVRSTTQTVEIFNDDTVVLGDSCSNIGQPQHRIDRKKGGVEDEDGEECEDQFVVHHAEPISMSRRPLPLWQQPIPTSPQHVSWKPAVNQPLRLPLDEPVQLKSNMWSVPKESPPAALFQPRKEPDGEEQIVFRRPLEYHEGSAQRYFGVQRDEDEDEEIILQESPQKGIILQDIPQKGASTDAMEQGTSMDGDAPHDVAKESFSECTNIHDEDTSSSPEGRRASRFLHFNSNLHEESSSSRAQLPLPPYTSNNDITSPSYLSPQDYCRLAAAQVGESTSDEALVRDASRYEFDPVVGCFFDKDACRFVVPRSQRNNHQKK